MEKHNSDSIQVTSHKKTGSSSETILPVPCTVQTQTETTRTFDQFEGLFYTINENDTRTKIMFKSSVLCDIIKNKITADFNQPSDVTLYNISTRVRNEKCLLSLDLETNELEITGPGRKAWTEIKFRQKMPEFIVQFICVTNTSSQDLSSPETQTQVCMNTPPDGSYSNQQPNSVASHTQIQNICDAINNLQNETSMLRKEISTFKQDKQTYAAVLSRNETTTYQDQQTDGSVTSSKNTDSNISSQHDIEVVISDRSANDDALRPDDTPRRPPTVREVQTSSLSSDDTPIRPPTVSEVQTINESGNKVLIMSDSIMHGVNMKGLKNNVHKHSVSGATIQTLITDIDMYDLTQFDTIALYIGGNDLSRKRDPELIEEEYDQLIALIKSRNET